MGPTTHQHSGWVPQNYNIIRNLQATCEHMTCSSRVLILQQQQQQQQQQLEFHRAHTLCMLSSTAVTF